MFNKLPSNSFINKIYDSSLLDTSFYIVTKYCWNELQQQRSAIEMYTVAAWTLENYAHKLLQRSKIKNQSCFIPAMQTIVFKHFKPWRISHEFELRAKSQRNTIKWVEHFLYGRYCRNNEYEIVWNIISWQTKIAKVSKYLNID